MIATARDIVTPAARLGPQRAAPWLALLLAINVSTLAPYAAAAQAIAASSSDLPFSGLPYADARAAAAVENRLLVVVATSESCKPCDDMERVAWSDYGVGEWISEHAIATRLDIEAQKELASELKLRETPAIVVFRTDGELARQSGPLDASGLLMWLLQLQREEVNARIDLADELARNHQDEGALAHYVWAWRNGHEWLAVDTVRLNTVLADMSELASRYEPAAQAFTSLFDSARARVTKADAMRIGAWKEFAAWCRCFDREDEFITWFEAHRRADGSLATTVAIDDVLAALVERGRWVEAARLGDLREMARWKVGLLGVMSMQARMGGPEQVEKLTQALKPQRDALILNIVQMSAALWSAGREDGREIAQDLLVKADDVATRLLLVELTLQAVGAQPEQVEWLDQAEAGGGDAEVIAELRQRIGAAATPSPLTTPEPGSVEPASAPEPLR